MFVGLLDLSVTTYLNIEDLSAMRVVLPVDERSIDQLAFPSDLFVEPGQIATAPADRSVRRTKSTYSYDSRQSPDHRSQRNAMAVLKRPSAGFTGRRTANCRTVTYPFIGEYYVVQVTDETGCLIGGSLRSSKIRLLAKNFPLRIYR